MALLCILCAIYVFPQAALGADSGDPEPHELVLLFDNSKTMSDNDAALLAPDALRQILGSLPSHWHVGLVTFHTEVVDVVAPGADTRPAIHTILTGVRYTGEANAGAGLFQAVNLFSDHAHSRTIIFVTDGNIATIPTTAAGANSIILAQEMIAEITASDIQVHTIAVRNELAAYHQHEALMGLAEATGGYLFRDISAEGLGEIASTLVFDVLGVARNRVAVRQIADSIGNFTIPLPARGPDAVRVLITGEPSIGHIAVSGNGSGIDIQRGQGFALVEILRQTDQAMDIEVTARGARYADVILEQELEAGSGPPPSVVEGLLERWAGGSALLIAIIVGGFVLLLLLVLYLRRSRLRRRRGSPVAQAVESKFDFAGKLDVYVRTIVNDTDVSDQTEHLFPLGKDRSISLRAILRKCRVSSRIPGLNYVYFTTDKQGSLQVMNDSDGTVLVGATPLGEKQAHTLSHGERVSMRCAGDGTELVISPRFLYRVMK